MTIIQLPPPERLLRPIRTRMDSTTREYVGRRLAEINTRKRRLRAEREGAAASFKALEKDLDTESVSLESAPPVQNGQEVEILFPCEGRVNITTGQFDIYVLERDEEGRESPRFVRSESLPDKYLPLFQGELPYDKNGPGAPSGGGSKRGKDKDKPKDAPPDFPGEDDSKK